MNSVNTTNEREDDASSLTEKNFKGTATCDNCHSPINGPFCSNCGQAVESTLKYFWTVILHLLDDIFSFDSRASRTLFPLLFKPGFLTKEYFSGRRVHYVPPLRLYLFISIIFFLSLKFFTDSQHQGVIKVAENPQLIEEVNQHISSLKSQEQNNDVTQEIERFQQYLADFDSKEKFVLREMTEELLQLEMKIIESGQPLTDKRQAKFDLLKSNIALYKAGKPLIKTADEFSIGNQKDGSVAFDFLTPSANEKLKIFAEDFERKVIKALDNEPKKLITMALDKLPQLMFILLPIFALLLKMLYLLSNRLYLEHLTVALHSHSFIFFVILLLEILDLATSYSTQFPIVGDISSLLMTLLLIWIPIYLFLMQKIVYQQGILLTLVKFVVISMLYVIMLSFTSVIAFIWGVSAS